jgi:hypothetical protein
MAYTIQQADAAYLPIANIDPGVLPPVATSSGSTTTIPTPPNVPGMVVKAVDPTFGGGEFILLAGVASTIVGSVVVYDSATYLTALAPVGSNLPQPVAIAMAANTATTSWAWYQIGGIAVAAKTSALALASNAAVGVKTAGLVATTGSGKEIQGALTVAKATTPKTVKLIIDRPHMQGRIT